MKQKKNLLPGDSSDASSPDSGLASENKTISNTKAESPEFTPRETEILHLLALGKSRKDIAHALKISTKTVDSFLEKVRAKTNLHTAQELTRYAMLNGY